MTPRLVLGCLGLAWIGTTMLLDRTRWARRVRLDQRITPYLTGPAMTGAGPGVLSVASFSEVLGPLAQQIGGRLASLFGAADDLAVKLERVHSHLTAQSFRLRQVGWSLTVLGVSMAIVIAAVPPGWLALLLLIGAPLLSFLVLEQRMHRRAADWQERIFYELPVIAEQMGILLSAGFSVGSALGRLAQRGQGACAADLRRVSQRIRHGLSEEDALQEWADTADVEALDRLTSVLRLNHESGDLGRLVSDEASTTRREAHRRQIELIERKGQQVWIPVTVAALVPGVVFLAVPFLDAMRMFGAA